MFINVIRLLDLNKLIYIVLHVEFYFWKCRWHTILYTWSELVLVYVTTEEMGDLDLDPLIPVRDTGGHKIQDAGTS